MRPRTFPGPRARAASAAQTVESSPPDSPRMPFRKPCLKTSSRMNRVRTFSTKDGLIFRGTDDPLQGAEDDLGLFVTLEEPVDAGRPNGFEVDPVDEKLGV